MARSAPHRDLRVTSPHTAGADVLAFQKGYNRSADEYGMPRMPEDGDLGVTTLRLGRKQAYYRGLTIEHWDRGRPLTRRAQQVVRAPWRRTPAERRRGKARYVARRKYLDANSGPAAALAWARDQVGVTESPAGSNRGRKVSAWQRETAGIDGAPWCGAFVGKALLVAGVDITARIVYCPYIVDDGEAGRNGMAKRVRWQDRKPGDLIVFGSQQHVGILDSDRTHTIEGNTSAGSSGSQDNGGGVFRRDRGSGWVAAVIRPDW